MNKNPLYVIWIFSIMLTLCLLNTKGVRTTALHKLGEKQKQQLCDN